MFDWLAGIFSEAPKKEDKKRVHLVMYLTPEIKDRILRIQKESGAKDVAVLLRWVFAVYEELLEIERNNGIVIVEDADGQKKRLLIRPKKTAGTPAT